MRKAWVLMGLALGLWGYEALALVDGEGGVPTITRLVHIVRDVGPVGFILAAALLVVGAVIGVKHFLIERRSKM